MFYVGNIKWKIKTYLIHFCLIDNVWPVSWSQDLHIVITFHEKWLDPRKIAILIFLFGCLNSLLPEFQNLLIITMQMTTHLSSVYFFQIVAGPSIYVAHQELYTIWIKRIMFIKFILKSVLFFCYTSQSYSLLIFYSTFLVMFYTQAVLKSDWNYGSNTYYPSFLSLLFQLQFSMYSTCIFPTGMFCQSGLPFIL